MPGRWLSLCLESVADWAREQAFDYHLSGDEIFDLLPLALNEKFRDQAVVRSDLARLLSVREALNNGYQRAVWVDADFLIFDSQGLELPDASFSPGREVWVQGQGSARRAYKKVHNAFMQFTSQDPFLDFWIAAATRLLDRADAPVVQQFIGPKFLTVQHNIVDFDEVKPAAMFSPLVMQDILNGGGEALDLMLRRQESPVCGANLSLSHIGREIDGVLIGEAEASEVTERLLKHKEPLRLPD